jgi:hypothetical protein
MERNQNKKRINVVPELLLSKLRMLPFDTDRLQLMGMKSFASSRIFPQQPCVLAFYKSPVIPYQE